MTIEEIEEELVLIRKQMVPLMKRQDYLSRQLEQLRSIRFISTHRITKSDVEFSSGEGKPYFSTVYDFARWMRSEQKIKRFAEWNGMDSFISRRICCLEVFAPAMQTSEIFLKDTPHETT